MFKPIISKPVIRMAAAACIASAVAFAITASPAASNGGSQAKDAATQRQMSTTARHLRVPIRPNVCSAHGWPNFEPKCLFDLREPAGEARTVRVIALR
jgi:hypothetical protein